MIPDPQGVLDRYAERGTRRSSTDVFIAAKGAALACYTVDRDEAPLSMVPRKWVLPALAAGLAAVLAVFSALVASYGSERVPVGVDVPATTATTHEGLTPEEKDLIERNYQAQVDSGWLAWTIDPVTPDASLPDHGYAPTGTNGSSVPSTMVSTEGIPRMALFDKPNGMLLGYSYPNLGFIRAGEADAPGFDVAALYRARGLCAPNEADCVGGTTRPPG